MSIGYRIGITLKVAYEGLVSNSHELEPTERHITFHKHDFKFPGGLREGFRHWRQRQRETSIGSQDDAQWEKCSISDDDTFLIADDPLLPCGLAVLSPILPLFVDVFSHAFQGTTVYWWD
ncbi:hypothetical protein TrVFT333_006641 [Trichoderma virens FT-333]|nr:hypothetical protein TrVFT333_006641 [Trichoderma virens FT-333]